MNKLIHSSLLAITLVIVAYVLVFGITDGQTIVESIVQMSWTYWLMILGLSMANYLLRYWRWHLYLAEALPASLSHWRHVAIYMAGFAFTMTPGKAGEMTRCVYLKSYGVSSQKTMGAFFVERIMDLLVIVLMSTWVISIFSLQQSLLAVGIAAILVGTAIAIIHLPKDKVMNSRLIKALPVRIQSFVLFVESSLDAARDLLTFERILMAVVLGSLAWGLEGLGLYLVMQHFVVDNSTLLIAIGIYGFGMLLGALSFLPGGVGGAEAAMVFMLMKAGFDSAQAIAITFICRLATLWFAVGLGILFTLGLSMSGLKPTEKKV